MNELIKFLAEKLGIPADEDGVKAAIVARLAKGEAAQSSLASVLSALGVEDVSGTEASLKKMVADAAALIAAFPEMGKAEEASAEEDTDETMAATAAAAVLRPAILAQRTGGVSLAGLKGLSLAAALVIRYKARDAFRAAYPRAANTNAAAANAHAQALTRPALPPPMSQWGAAAPQVMASALGTTLTPVASAGPDLERYSALGLNATACALRWCADNEGPSFAALAYQDKFQRACAVLTQARAAGFRG